MGKTLRDAAEICNSFKPNLVILDTSTPSIYNDVIVGEKIKDFLPNSLVILVGTHPSALPEETLTIGDKIDAIARGEYDYTIQEVADRMRELNIDSVERKTNKAEIFSGVKGISYRNQNREIVNNEDRELIENVDEIPFVSKVYKRYLDPKDYFFAAARYPMVMTMSARGCPYRCFFCVYPQVFHGRTFRPRSPENVTAEMDYIVEHFPEVKEIGFEDDTFTVNKDRVKNICKYIIEKGIQKKVKWWVNARVDTLDLETMRLMKEAGCRLLIPGFESGSQIILDNMKKDITLEQSKQFMENARKAGLLVHGCFMVGNPGETRDTMEQTLDFAKKLNPDTAQFFPLIVYPGTEAYNWAIVNNYLTADVYSDWVTEKGLHNTIINTSTLSAKELVEFSSKARREFYLRPTYLLYKLKQVLTNKQELVRTMRSLKSFVPHLLKR